MAETSVGPLPPQRRRELTRTALVEAAAEVFARKGFHAASLDEIAEAAGFTRGAIYSNFKSKDDLIIAVTDRYWEAQLDAFAEVLEETGGGPEERATAAAKLWGTIFRADPKLLPLTLELRLHALRDPTFRRRLAELHGESRMRMEELVKRQTREMGITLRFSPSDVAEMSWAASDGLVQLAAIDDEHTEHFDELARLLFEVLGEGVTKPPAG